MIAEETLAVKGYGTIEVRDAATGALIYCENYTNVVTDYVRDQIMQAFKGSAVSYEVTHIALGTGTTTPTAADTALETEVFRAAPTSIVDLSVTEIGYRLFLSASQGNGNTFSEIGLFDAASGGNMMARSTSFTPIVKNSSITITFTHILRYT